MTSEHDDPIHFEAPWHARISAISALLVETGALPAAALAEALGSERSQQVAKGMMDDETAYHEAVLRAAELALAARGVISETEIETYISRWRAAYLRTPHGAPVVLDDATG